MQVVAKPRRGDTFCASGYVGPSGLGINVQSSCCCAFPKYVNFPCGRRSAISAQILQRLVAQMSKAKIVVLGLVLVGGCAMSPLRRFEQSMVFQGQEYSESAYQAGRGFEDAWFESEDGTQLHGWFTAPPNPQGVMLYCHGNYGNVATGAATIRDLSRRHNLAVLIFDYRGYGRSSGTPNEAGLIADGKAARAWLAKRAQVAESEVILFGRSLGGGVAVQLAADDGARALILVSTFSSLPSVAANRLPFLMPKLIMQNRFESADRIGEYKGPLLQSHGDADQLILFAEGQKLHSAANEPKQFIRVERGGHNDPNPGQFHHALAQLLSELSQLH
jgi:uncharacterized protein